MSKKFEISGAAQYNVLDCDVEALVGCGEFCSHKIINML